MGFEFRQSGEISQTLIQSMLLFFYHFVEVKRQLLINYSELSYEVTQASNEGLALLQPAALRVDEGCHRPVHALFTSALSHSAITHTSPNMRSGSILLLMISSFSCMYTRA